MISVDHYLSDSEKSHLHQTIQALKEKVYLLSQQVALQHQQLLLSSQHLNYLHYQFAQQREKPNPYAALLLTDLVHEFVNSFSSLSTQRTYNEGFSQLYAQDFLKIEWTLHDFHQLNREKLLDDVRLHYKHGRTGASKTNGVISEYEEASESTKQLRCAMLLSFSTYLQRRTEGYITKIVSNKFGGNKTFRHRRQKTYASNISPDQMNSFLKALKTISVQAYLIAILQILGARRITEVLQLQMEDLDLSNKRIFFRVLKGKGLLKEPIVIYLPDSVLKEIHQLVGDRKEGFLFSPKKYDQDSKVPFTKTQVAKLYERGWKNLPEREKDKSSNKIPYKPKMITHALRAFAITTLYDRNIDSQLIREITGHSSADMTAYYKLTSSCDNVTKKIHVFEPDF